MTDIAGQTVVIVGASSGIGLATARAAATAEARVVMLSRSRNKLDAAAASVQGNVRTMPMDMLDRDAVDRTIESIGRIDHLVLTAVANEYVYIAPLASLENEQIEHSFDKLRGFANVSRAAARRLDGSITMVSAVSAVKPGRGMSMAAAAAGAVASFGKALAIELAPLRVNVVMPGLVDTTIHENDRPAIKSWTESALPARRFGQPEDIASAILFLMTNPYMTGATLVIDGGLTAL
jgi:NAD(P)-dependent dehydrogenase (short-subunit alcohol dehydrogenase family)